MTRRSMIRRWVGFVAAGLAPLASVTACAGTDSTTNAGHPTPTPSSGAPSTDSSDQPIDITRIPEGALLEPGTYSMPFVTGDGETRAIVEVPDGYTNHFSVIGSDGGDMAFWGSVTRVDTDPCLGGKHVGAGTSVHDLASLLVAQRYMKTSQPVPVTIDGYHGVYLKSTVPADVHRCRGGVVTMYTDGNAWLQQDVPHGIFQAWILNVRGQRVVGGTRIIPGAGNGAELSRMVTSAEFTVVSES
jgi:hypothetical protein